MNLVLLVVTLFAVGILLSESVTVRSWINHASGWFYKPVDTGLNFLLGIDHIKVTEEEIEAFKKFLLEPPADVPSSEL